MTTGFGFPLGCALGTAALTLAIGLGATAHPLVAVVVLAAGVVLVARLSTPTAALGTATVCWAMLDGFVLGRHGTLVFPAASGRAAVTLLATALTTSAILAASAHRSRGTALTPPDAHPGRPTQIPNGTLVPH